MKRSEMIKHIARCLKIFPETKKLDENKRKLYANSLLNQVLDYGMEPPVIEKGTFMGKSVPDFVNEWEPE